VVYCFVKAAHTCWAFAAVASVAKLLPTPDMVSEHRNKFQDGHRGGHLVSFATNGDVGEGAALNLRQIGEAACRL
jgi:hypothetical protein